MTKYCRGCDQHKPLSDFSANRRASDGKQNKCKVCKRAQVKAWEDTHPGRKLELQQAWREANPNYIGDYQRQWRDENRERARDQWRKAAHIRRAREAEAFIEAVDPLTVYETHQGICGICQLPVDAKEFEIDHIIPIAKGGLHGYSNVQPAHRFCNRSKRDRIPEENALRKLVNPDSTVS